MRILVADRDPERLELYSRILEENNYLVLRAKNQTELFETYRKQWVDVVVADLSMPGALEIMKSIQDKPKVAISGFSELEDVARAFYADEVVTRPLERIKDLITAIKYVTQLEPV